MTARGYGNDDRLCTRWATSGFGLAALAEVVRIMMLTLGLVVTRVTSLALGLFLCMISLGLILGWLCTYPVKILKRVATWLCVLVCTILVMLKLRRTLLVGTMVSIRILLLACVVCRVVKWTVPRYLPSLLSMIRNPCTLYFGNIRSWRRFV